MLRASVFTFTLAIIVYALIYTSFLLIFCFSFWMFVKENQLKWTKWNETNEKKRRKKKNTPNHNHNNNNRRHCNYDTLSVKNTQFTVCVGSTFSLRSKDLCVAKWLTMIYARAHSSEMINKLNYIELWPVVLFARWNFEISTLDSLKHPV